MCALIEIEVWEIVRQRVSRSDQNPTRDGTRVRIRVLRRRRPAASGKEFTEACVKLGELKCCGQPRDDLIRCWSPDGPRRDAAAHAAVGRALVSDEDAERSRPWSGRSARGVLKGDAARAASAEKRGALREEVRELRQQQRKVAALQKQADDAPDEGADETRRACWDA